MAFAPFALCAHCISVFHFVKHFIGMKLPQSAIILASILFF